MLLSYRTKRYLGGLFMNFFNKKTKRVITIVIVAIVVLAMVIPLVYSAFT